MADLLKADLPHRVVTTAGHVDHGKSTLLRILTGQEPDRLREEQQRGLTIELGYVWGSFATHTVAFVDVPGHERFISTMLAGTGASPATLFVVAADDGWSKQSEEHRDILSLLGVPGVVTVITKADTVSSERLEEVVAQVRDALAGTTLAPAPIVVTDAITNRGIDTLKQVLAERLDMLEKPLSGNRPRLWIDRAFAIAGAGAVVTGTLVDGTFTTDDEVRVLPLQQTTRIRGVQSLGTPVLQASQGSRVALNLVGVSYQQVKRGDTIVGGEPWQLSHELDCLLTVLDGQTVSEKGAWEVYVGSTSTPATVQIITNQASANTPGIAVRLRVARPLVVVCGDRFILRESGRRRIVAGGIVTDPAPPPLPRGRPARQHHHAIIERLAFCNEDARMMLLADVSGGVCADALLVARAGWNLARPLPDGLVSVGGMSVTATRLKMAYMALHAMGAGVHTREQAAQVLGGTGLSAPACRAVLTVAEQARVIVRVAGGFVLPEHLDDAERVRLRRVALLLDELNLRPLAPPPIDETAQEVGMNHRDILALVSAGTIVKVGTLMFTAEAIAHARSQLGKLADTSPTFTASDARQIWDTSRKYAIPLLEHFDRTGVTRFDGQMRTLI